MSDPLHPGAHIRQTILPPGMTVTQAAKQLRVGRPALSNLLNGNAALSPDMAAKIEQAFGASANELLAMQAAYDAAIAELRGRANSAIQFVAPFLQIKANDIENWADGNIASRTRLSVLLRILVHTTGAELTSVNFPGNDDAERPGWDGYVEAGRGMPWVPAGRSGWEFGVNQDVKGKADGDFDKSVKAVKPAERAQTTFIFVSPRRWAGKDRWVSEQRAKNLWKDVRAYDASDLEQLMAQSIPAQAWFAQEMNHPSQGTLSLEASWRLWCADSSPQLVPALFDEPVSLFGQRLLERLKRPQPDTVLLTANSEGEAIAFLYRLFSDPEAESLKDRAVVFKTPGALSKIARGAIDFIPIIAGAEVEKEFAPLKATTRAIVISTPKSAGVDPDFEIEPLSAKAFEDALGQMGCSRDTADNLARRSGRVLTVLRRQLSTLPSIRNPEWATNGDLARKLIPMVLAGVWNSKDDADQTVMGLLTSGLAAAKLEQGVAELLQLEDSPVWSIGAYRGVVSKIDALFAVARNITADDLATFFEVALLVLSEDDPALDLPEDKRWMASAYDKSREISGPLRRGISETLVLLAVYGNELFGGRLSLNVEDEVRKLIRQLLVPGNERAMEAQSDDIPMYAEASPDAFLSIIEKDLQSADSAVRKLVRPTTSSMFGRSPRVGLLWGLENVAWSPEHFSRAVDVLAELGEIRLDDNLVNKPSESLSAIFRNWMPQTAAGLQQRQDALARLVRCHPDIAWGLAVQQFDPTNTIGHFSHKPRWRPDAVGFGEPRDNKEAFEFRKFALELTLKWPTTYTVEKLADLLRALNELPEEYSARVWTIIEEWAKTASDADKADLRERLRVSIARAKRRARRNSVDHKVAQVTASAEAALEPQDLIYKHAWLFKNYWVELGAEELEDDTDYKDRDQRIAKKRLAALKEIMKARGLGGVIALAATGEAQRYVGVLLTELLRSRKARLATLRELDEVKDPTLVPVAQNMAAGLLGALQPDEMITALNDLAANRRSAEVVELGLRAPFSEPVWRFVQSRGSELEGEYWRRVHPNIVHDDDQIAFAVEKLLTAQRPIPAFVFGQYQLKKLRPKLLFRLLRELAGTPIDERDKDYRLDQHWLGEAFKQLTASDEIRTSDMAALEFRYIDALGNNKAGLPNLEQQIQDEPSLFAEALAWAFKRKHGGEDPASLQEPDPEKGRRRAGAAYTMLRSLKRLPGRNPQGELEGPRLLEWVRKVRETSASLDRIEVCDSQLGQFLGKGPELGSDGAWPREAVRDVLEQVTTEEFTSGFRIGVYNARGVHTRGEGGKQERDLAAKYRGWADAVERDYPLTAKRLLEIAQSYERDAKSEDTEAGIRRRLG